MTENLCVALLTWFGHQRNLAMFEGAVLVGRMLTLRLGPQTEASKRRRFRI